eukprot:5112396-Pleurochrysis_carterae.AAC.1
MPRTNALKRRHMHHGERPNWLAHAPSCTRVQKHKHAAAQAARAASPPRTRNAAVRAHRSQRRTARRESPESQHRCRAHAHVLLDTLATDRLPQRPSTHEHYDPIE